MMTAIGPGTAIGGGGAAGPQGKVLDGQYTVTVYTLIKDQQHLEVIKVLERELQVCPSTKTSTLVCLFRFPRRMAPACTPRGASGPEVLLCLLGIGSLSFM